MTSTLPLTALRTLLLGAALLAAQPVLAKSLTVTGANGGTIQTSRDCTRGSGQASCATSSTATSPSGQTATKARTRVTAAGSSATTVTRTGPNGQSNTRTRTWSVTP